MNARNYDAVGPFKPSSELNWWQQAVDHGVSVRRKTFVTDRDHKGLPIRTEHGPYVYMIKNEPGVYYDEKGRKLPDTMAEIAGYNVKLNKRMYEHNQKVGEARTNLEKQFRQELAKYQNERVVLDSQGDYEIVLIHGDNDYVNIEDSNGNLLIPRIHIKEAKRYLENLTSAHADDNVDPAKTPAKGV